jgi:hypothetical protein
VKEAETCRKFVVSKLQAKGWDMDVHPIAKQYPCSRGQLEVTSELDQQLDAHGQQLRVADLTTNCMPVGPMPARTFTTSLHAVMNQLQIPPYAA